MKKIITIIVPTYNMEQYLSLCLNSLIVKDDLIQHIEVIVINDGSTDNSLSIANIFAQKHPTIFRIIDKENGNYGSCINVGLKEANGKYIKILDADDSFDTSEFEKLIRILLHETADLILTDFCIVNKRMRQIKKEVLPIKTCPNNTLTFDQITNLAYNMAMHRVTYRTDILRQINYQQSEGISYTDTEWIFLPFSNIKTIRYYKLIVYKYLIGRNEQTIDEDIHIKRMNEEEIGVLKNIEQISTIPTGNEAYEYLKRRIFQRIRTIYHATLAVPQNNMFNLKDFEDKHIKTNFDFWYYTNNLSINCILFKYHLIRHWRKTYNQTKLQKTLKYRIYHIIRQLHKTYIRILLSI